MLSFKLDFPKHYYSTKCLAFISYIGKIMKLPIVLLIENCAFQNSIKGWASTIYNSYFMHSNVSIKSEDINLTFQVMFKKNRQCHIENKVKLRTYDIRSYIVFVPPHVCLTFLKN